MRDRDRREGGCRVEDRKEGDRRESWHVEWRERDRQHGAKWQSTKYVRREPTKRYPGVVVEGVTRKARAFVGDYNN